MRQSSGQVDGEKVVIDELADMHLAVQSAEGCL